MPLASKGTSQSFLFAAHQLGLSTKGGSLLIEVLKQVLKKMTFRLVTFGSGGLHPLGFIPHRHLGFIENERMLATAYSCAALTLVPSQVKSFGLIAAESLACGVPVVCFNTSGLKDVVEHQLTGYRAEVFSVEDFARGIQWCLADKDRYEQLCLAARKSAEKRFSLSRVADLHQEFYQQVLD